MEERLMAKNEFEQPKVLKDNHAVITNIIRLIIADPGTYPLHPEMGVGLFTKFKFGWSDEVVITLRSEILKQMNMYMPDLTSTSVSIKSVDHELHIIIQFNSTLVTLVTDTANKILTINELKGE